MHFPQLKGQDVITPASKIFRKLFLEKAMLQWNAGRKGEDSLETQDSIYMILSRFVPNEFDAIYGDVETMLELKSYFLGRESWVLLDIFLAIPADEL